MILTLDEILVQDILVQKHVDIVRDCHDVTSAAFNTVAMETRASIAAVVLVMVVGVVGGRGQVSIRRVGGA